MNHDQETLTYEKNDWKINEGDTVFLIFIFPNFPFTTSEKTRNY